ncbi:MAG: 2-phospho-L-lactate guanylyltransferase [Thaumarchaeota archaeon]|nr:2-phospho-L-lactate guanylyltransferase [Nitrososphaerota archaeon]
MTSLAVIIPAKSTGAKSRLSAVLTPQQRVEFALFLLRDVIGVLNQAGLGRSGLVVSPDQNVLDAASSLGVRSVREPGGKGVNSAVARGIQEAGDADAVLVIPSDLPTLRASDLKHLSSLRARGIEIAIAPSMSFDGTNALLFPTASPLPLSYDDDSFWNHLAAAARSGLTTAVCSAPGLMFDVDTVDDLRTLAGSRVERPSARFARSVIG